MLIKLFSNQSHPGVFLIKSSLRKVIKSSNIKLRYDARERSSESVTQGSDQLVAASDLVSTTLKLSLFRISAVKVE